MQKFIAKYGMAAHLAILAVAPLFLLPSWCLWLSVLGLIWVFMCPSKLKGEYVHEARVRVLYFVLTDPLFWISLLFVLYSLVRYVNSGVAFVYDFEKTAWKISLPKVFCLPGSTQTAGQVEFVMSFVFLIVVQACRHAMGRSARYMFCAFVTMVAGTVGIFWCYRLSLGVADALSLAACSQENPLYVGSLFGACSLFGIVALFATFERKWNLLAVPLMLGLGGCLAGLFVFAPARVQVVYSGAVLLLVLYSFFCAWRKLSNSAEFRFLVVFAVSLLLGGACVMLMMPKDLMEVRIAPYLTGEFLTEEFMTVREILSRVSLEVWKAHPWVGGGLGSFPLYLNSLATDSDWLVLVTGQVAPLNGYWLILAEGGIVGAMFLIVPVSMLLVSCLLRFVQGWGCGLPSPACLAGPLVLVVVLVDSLTSSSLAQPSLYLIVAALLAVATAAFPKGA